MITIKRLTLDQAESGTRLAQDVCNANGTCLLPQGTVLSYAVIASLKRREVDYVMVEVEEELTQERHTTLETIIRARVERQFSKTDTDPLMLKLRDLLLRYRLAELTHQSNPSAMAED